MIYRASTPPLSLSVSLCEAKWAERRKGGSYASMKYGEGKRFLANYLCNVELLSFLLFSRNNCRDNVASVWIPLVFPSPLSV